MGIDSIAEKLAVLRKADPGFALEAASAHRYRTHPTLSDRQLRAMERRFGIELPHGYREFLDTIGNGGAGPYNGILSLEESLSFWVERPNLLQFLKSPFSLTDDVNFADEYDAEPVWENHVRRWTKDASYRDAIDQVTEKYSQPRTMSGTLRICEYGCGDFLFLVVGGLGRGMLWADSTLSSTGIFSLKVDFVTWYERWIDDALRRVRVEEFRTPDATYAFLAYGDNERYSLLGS